MFTLHQIEKKKGRKKREMEFLDYFAEQTELLHYMQGFQSNDQARQMKADDSHTDRQFYRKAFEGCVARILLPQDGTVLECSIYV